MKSTNKAKKLQKRIHDYYTMLSKETSNKSYSGYKKPGSNKK